MNLNGPCKILKIYLNETTRHESHSLYHALVLALREAGLAGVTVTRGIEGYGRGKRLHSSRILDLSLDLPIIVEAVDQADRIEAALPLVKAMVREGLILTTDVTVVAYGGGASVFSSDGAD